MNRRLRDQIIHGLLVGSAVLVAVFSVLLVWSLSR